MLNIVIVDKERVQTRINQVYIENFMEKSKITYQVDAFCKYSDKLLEKMEQRIDIALIGLGKTENQQTDRYETDGIFIANKLKEKHKNIMIIFISSQKEYAWDAYQLQALGYLKKPVGMKEFNEAFSKAVIFCIALLNRSTRGRMIQLARDKFLNEGDIIALEKEGHRLFIYTKNATETVYTSLKEFCAKLEMERYLYINKGVMVSKRYIKRITDSEVEMSDGRIFYISNRKKKKVITEFSEYAGSS